MDDQPPRDSMGNLRPSCQTSAERLPNLKLQSARPNSGQEQPTERKAARTGVLRTIQMIADIFGEPWGKDEEAGKRFKDGWTFVLGDLPDRLLLDATIEFLKSSETRWPKPGMIRELVVRRMPEQPRSDRHGIRVTYEYANLPDEILRCPKAQELMDQGCTPHYVIFRHKDRELTRQMVANVNAMDTATLRRLGIDDRALTAARKITGEPILDSISQEPTQPNGAQAT